MCDQERLQQDQDVFSRGKLLQVYDVILEVQKSLSVLTFCLTNFGVSSPHVKEMGCDVNSFLA